MLIKGTVYKVHTNNTNRLLLGTRIDFVEPQMGANHGVGPIGFGLKLDSHPAMTFKLFGKVDGGYRICISKEDFFGSIFL